MSVISSYNQAAFRDLAEVVRKSYNQLEPYKDNWDAIAVRGVSGIIVGAPLAVALDKPLIVIRKPNENTHSPFPVEGFYKGSRYLIVDDFVFTGATMKAIQTQIKVEESFKHYQLAAVYLWSDKEYLSGQRLEKAHWYLGKKVAEHEAVTA